MIHLEKQQRALAADPKSSCIDSSGLLSAAAAAAEPDTFWQSMVVDYPKMAVKAVRLLTTRLRQQGILPASWRGIVWQVMAQSCDTHLASIYDKLVQGEMGISSFERIIDRDLGRLAVDNSLVMARLLKAYSVYDAHVGYSQGLAMLARPILMVVCIPPLDWAFRYAKTASL